MCNPQPGAVTNQVLKRLILAIVFSPVVAYGAATTERPNILLLVAEDLSPRIGAYGDAVARTPNLDELAKRATRYTRAFTTAGVCAPSRAALITGQHQISFGGHHMRTSTGPLGEFYAQPASGVRAFPELLRQHGYFTFTDRKLDYQFSGILAHSGPFSIWDAENASDTAWRDRDPDQPFFGLINFFETHESGVMRPTGPANSEVHARTQAMRAQLVAAEVTPPEDVVVPPYYPDTETVRSDIARHYNNVHKMDERVGAILAALEADGLRDSTIIIWTSDHGDGLPRAKRELYDSGLHVPMLIARPEHPNSDVDDRLVSFVDLAPTILRWAGIEPPSYHHGQPIDGNKRRYIYASRDRIDEIADRQRAVRDVRYKYIRSYYPELPGGHKLAYRDNLDMVREMRSQHLSGELNPAQNKWFEANGAEQLYDLKLDPHELINLAQIEDYAPIRKRLSTALDRFLDARGDLGNTPEAQLKTQWTNQGEVPTTAPPVATVKDGSVHLHHPAGASIGYRISPDGRWRLYTTPLTLSQGASVEAKAVRYGWRESSIVVTSP